MAGTTASVALKAAINKRLLGPSKSIELKFGQPQPLGLFYDLDVFERGLKDVQNAFGAGFLHAMAVKANPVNSIIKIVCNETKSA